MIEFLLANWKIILIAILISLLGALGKLYSNKVHEYDLFKAQVVATSAAVEAEQDKAKKASDELIATKEKEHAEAIDDLDHRWAAELGGLRKYPSGSRTGEPISILANVCDDTTANQRLSDAIQKFEQRLDDAIGNYQDGVGRLLEDADKDATTLAKVNEWASGEKLINR